MGGMGQQGSTREQSAPGAPRGVVVVVGAGPGIGLAVARRFGGQGAAVVLVARDGDRVEALGSRLRGEGVAAHACAADATDFPGLRATLERVRAHVGVVTTLCYSPLPELGRIRPVLETSAEDLMASLALSVGGAATAVNAVLPGMLAAGGGQLLFTTGSGALRPSVERAASATSTTAQSVYVELLRGAVDPAVVRVAHLTVVGAVGESAAGAVHEPAAVAEALSDLAAAGGGSSVLDRPAAQ